VKFLVDECLTRDAADRLTAAGHDAVHVGDLGLLGATDLEVMASAVDGGRVVVSADTDFGELLAKGGRTLPSVILLRRHHDPAGQAAAILASMPDIEESLTSGAIVVITDDRVRIRSLPIG
jgi:predicted nuclease of predicted toxin-antitoxin system